MEENVESQKFEITPGPWCAKITFSSTLSRFIFTIRDTNGNRVESGLPDDLAIDVEGARYPVFAKSAIRENMQNFFGYSASLDDLHAPGGQDSGVIQCSIPTAVKEIYISMPGRRKPSEKMESSRFCQAASGGELS